MGFFCFVLFLFTTQNMEFKAWKTLTTQTEKGAVLYNSSIQFYKALTLTTYLTKSFLILLEFINHFAIFQKHERAV